MPSTETNKPVNPFKKTDYRHALWVKDRKAMREKAKKKSFKVELGPQSQKKGVITVDTSKARSNLDVLRICLKNLGWREVNILSLLLN